MPSKTRRRALAAAIGASTLLAFTGTGTSAVAGPAAGPGTSAGTTPAVKYIIANPAFTPLSVNGVPARALYGTYRGAGYEIEVPAHWNHQLVLYAHGYAGTGNVLTVDQPFTPLRQHWLDRGYAWAASSYDANGYNVPSGVRGTHDLIGLFRGRVGRPTQTFMTGLSMGGQISGVEIETYPEAFNGALTWCGVMGDNQLFNYYYNYAQGAAALTGTPGQFPPPFPDPKSDPYVTTVQTKILPKLGTMPNRVGFPTVLNPKGRQFESLAEQLTGGARPGFSGAFQKFWNGFGFPPLTQIPFVFGLFGSSLGGTQGIAPGNTNSNVGTHYSLAKDPTVALTSRQRDAGADTVNDKIQRVAASPAWLEQLEPDHGLKASIPTVGGNLPVPLLTIHGTGDMFVPLSMEQVLYQRAKAAGRTNLLVQRAVREVGHCSYSGTELANGFDAMTRWVKTGDKPAGDNIMAPLTKGYDPNFGCRFTQPDSSDKHPVFAATNPGLAPCAARDRDGAGDDSGNGDHGGNGDGTGGGGNLGPGQHGGNQHAAGRR